MCGRQPLILVKVLSAIVKFTPEQVEEIIRLEEKTKLSARSRPLLASSGRDLGATPSSGTGCFYRLSRPASSKIVMCEGDHDAAKGIFAIQKQALQKATHLRTL